MTNNIYKQLSEERKIMQEQGTLPEWFTTAGWQLFKQKYLYQADTYKEQIERIVHTAAEHLPEGFYERAYNKFYELFWKGWLSPSTPILSNMGTARGMSVSCSGNKVANSIRSFYESRTDNAILTKECFGVSSDLSSINPRGTELDEGFKAAGVLPVFKGFVQDTIDVTQGANRRGAWAGYLDIEHGDFDEVLDYVTNNPDGANLGWNVHDSFIQKLEDGDEESDRRNQKSLARKMICGRGYYTFIDKINRQRPDCYKKHGLFVNNGNLCNEITLFNDEDHIFTCVLASMNVAKYDEWKDTDAVYWATIFLDCVAEDFIQKGKKKLGLEKAVRFTEKGRALGLGQMGYHSYLQSKLIPYESLESLFLSSEIAQHIDEQSLRASKYLAKILGEPEWCVGYGIRNTHRIAIAPTKSSSLLMGGVSEGINPDPAMVFTQDTAGGEVDRINPQLLKLMKERDVFNKKEIRAIKDNNDSVQEVSWLSDEEKAVFKTAFEINMEAHLRLCSQRQPFVCQGQSLNLFFAEDEDPEWISYIHKVAFKDENCLGLYYIYTRSGVDASKECESCQ